MRKKTWTFEIEKEGNYMDAEELYLYINNKFWELKWCQGDYFETQRILQEIEYARGAYEFYEKNL